MCGEGVPDFYAKQILSEDPYCINKAMDLLLKPLYDQVGLCQDIDQFGFAKDENDDPLISDCQTRDFVSYYLTKQSIAAFGALFRNMDGL